MVQTGSAWCNALLFKTGEVASEACTACGGKHTLEHIIWRCTKHREFRRGLDPEIAALDPDKLPAALKFGIAPALDVLQDTTFWGRDIADFKGQEDLTRGEAYNRSKTLLEEARKACKGKGNMRQIFQRLRTSDTPNKPESMPVPTKQYQDAPLEPNVFTDGSLHRQGSAHYTAAGAAAWHPLRTVREEESQLEREYCGRTYRSDGIVFSLPVYGQRVSSTRAKLVAALLGISAEKPTHITTDSKAFMDRAVILGNKAAQAISIEHSIHLDHAKAVEVACTHRPLKRNWTTIPDGDLWHAYWRACLHKGPNSIRYTKVKSHTDDDDIDQGIITVELHDGNEIADTNAKKAPNLRNEWALALTVFAQNRAAKYDEFMAKLQQFIIGMYKHERDRIDLDKRIAALSGIEQDRVQVDTDHGGSWRDINHDMRHRDKLVIDIPMETSQKSGRERSQRPRSQSS